MIEPILNYIEILLENDEIVVVDATHVLSADFVDIKEQGYLVEGVFDVMRTPQRLFVELAKEANCWNERSTTYSDERHAYLPFERLHNQDIICFVLHHKNCGKKIYHSLWGPSEASTDYKNLFQKTHLIDGKLSISIKEMSVEHVNQP